MLSLSQAKEAYRDFTASEMTTDLARSRLDLIQQDQVYFLYELWKDRGFEEPDKAPLGEIEEDMFNFLCDDRYFRRCCLGFRGVGKTHLVATFMSRRWRVDRTRQILLISKSKDEAKKTLGLVREWLNSVWFLLDLAPGLHEKDTTSSFSVAGTVDQRQPSMSVLGIGGQLEGNRAHDVIGDDIETKSNSKTLEARTELKRLWDEALRIVYPRKKPTDNYSIIKIGTPKNEDTIYLTDLKQGYRVQSYPIEYPAGDIKVISPAPIIVQHMADGKARPGDPTCPRRFNRDWIAIRKSSSEHEFLREDMLVADLGDAARYPLKLGNLIVTSVDRDLAPLRIVWGTSNHNGSTAIEDLPCHGLPEDRFYSPVHIESGDWAPYTCTVAAIDPAGRGNDRTGLAIGKMLAGMIWIPSVKGYRGGASAETMDTIVEELHRWNTREVRVEGNIDVFGAYVNLLEQAVRRRVEVQDQYPTYPQNWTCAVVDHRSQGRKEERIIAVLGPVINQHRMVMNRDCFVLEEPFDLDNDLAFQISRISLMPNCLPEDGKIDALAQVVKALEDATRADPEKAASKVKGARLDELAKMQNSLYAAAKRLVGGRDGTGTFTRHRG